MNRNLGAGLLSLLLLWAAPAPAADRALLIGVGDYPRVGTRLPGIGHDLRMMEEVARTLGFESDDIRILKDEEASLAAVRRTLEEWLTRGVDPEDRLLIYFSGHGSRVADENGDETEDRADEVLLLHDAEVVQGPGGAKLRGVLVDDDFNRLLRGMPSRHVLILIDACHSGTATKAVPDFSQEAIPGKLFRYAGMPQGPADAAAPVEQGDEGNYAALSAAGDGEEALPGEQGSLFTRILYRDVQRAAREGTGLSLHQLQASIAGEIKQSVPRGQWFSPVLTGSRRLMHVGLGEPLGGRK
ncbi:MAG: caspase family protein [Gammaproteobacteria bacterium]|nr:caspase family protein [Gammaproteobacteria bacterium]MBU1655031.1 caspase family protein [Gammaproteobacteria bacterium]MBU1961528.1 caspase family protein [Gammaproteobacteria bacterium]